MRILSVALAVGLLIGPIVPALAQQGEDEPLSSVTVLVDLSESWHNQKNRNDNIHLLRVVGQAVVRMVDRMMAPVQIRYLPIGDISLFARPLCEVVFSPKLLAGRSRSGIMSNPRELASYLTEDCPTFLLSRPVQPLTDISGAIDTAARLAEQQLGNQKLLLVVSDMKEELRRGQAPVRFALPGFRMLVLYRPLDEDRRNPGSLDERIRQWRKRIEGAGAKVDLDIEGAATPARIERQLLD